MLGKVPGAGQHGPTHQPAPPAPKCWQGGCRQGRQLRTAASLSVQNGAGASPVCLRRGGQFVSGQQAVDGEWRPVDGRRVGDNGQSMGDGWETTVSRWETGGRRRPEDQTMGDGWETAVSPYQGLGGQAGRGQHAPPWTTLVRICIEGGRPGWVAGSPPLHAPTAPARLPRPALGQGGGQGHPGPPARRSGNFVLPSLPSGGKASRLISRAPTPARFGCN